MISEVNRLPLERSTYVTVCSSLSSTLQATAVHGMRGRWRMGTIRVCMGS